MSEHDAAERTPGASDGPFGASPPPDGRQQAAPGDTTATDATDDPIALGIASGKKHAEVAREAGCSIRTVQRRMQHPEFRRRVQELRGRMLGEAAGSLADAMTDAAAELRAQLANADPLVRHRAACKIIELGLKVREATEVDDRLSALEAALRGGRGNGDAEGAAGEDRSIGGGGARGALGPAGPLPPGPGEFDGGCGI
jgi:hypothetical protein